MKLDTLKIMSYRYNCDQCGEDFSTINVQPNPFYHLCSENCERRFLSEQSSLLIAGIILNPYRGQAVLDNVHKIREISPSAKDRMIAAIEKAKRHYAEHK